MGVKLKSKNRTSEDGVKRIVGRGNGVERKRGYECQNDRLLFELANCSKRKQNVEEIRLVEDDLPIDEKIWAFIKECKRSRDNEYVVITMLIFATSEPVEKSFVYNINNSAKNYLNQLANKFEIFRETGNFVDLIGCAAIITLSKNNGFLNMKVEEEVSIKLLDIHISKLANEEDVVEEDNSEYEEVEDDDTEDNEEVEDDE